MNKSIFEINNNGFDKRIDSLTSLRFLMILMIFLNHLSFLGDGTGNSIYDQYFHNPNMAVTFFFILSGFGLTYKSFLNKEYAINCHYNLKIGFSYAWKRMKKLYPLYIITMAAAIPFTLVVDFKSFGIMHGVIIDTIKLLVSVPLMQSAFGLFGIATSFNGVCWFMSTLFILYIAYPVLERINIKYISSSKLAMTSLLIVLILDFVVNDFFMSIENIQSQIDLSYTSPYIRIFHFIIGILLCDLFILRKSKRYSDANLLFNFQEFFMIIITFLWFFLRNSLLSGINIELRRDIDILISASVLYSFVFQRGVISKYILNQKWFVF